MKMTIDDYATLDSPLHRWSPREKLVGLAALILAFSLVDRLALVPAMVVTTAILFSLSRLPLGFWLTRIKLPGFFLLALGLVLPFFPTQASDASVLVQLGPIAIYQSGLLALVVIVARFLCIVTLGLLLFGTAPLMTTVQAMRRLGLPPILADMILLTYRYLYDIGDSFRTLRTAMRLRGFQLRRLNRRTLTALVGLAGSLLVRSYEQSERVYEAMRLRGYGQVQTLPGPRQPRSLPSPPAHRLALVATLMLSVSFIAIDALG